MEYEMEITERIREAVSEALQNEMALGWSLYQLIPMLNNAVADVIEEMEDK